MFLWFLGHAFTTKPVPEMNLTKNNSKGTDVDCGNPWYHVRSRNRTMRTALNSQKTGNSITIGWHWVYWCYTSHVNTTKALFRHETVVSPCMVAAKPKKFSTSSWAISWRMAQTSSRSLRACVELPWGGPQLAEQVHWRRFYRAPFPNWSLAGASNFTSLKLELKIKIHEIVICSIPQYSRMHFCLDLTEVTIQECKHEKSHWLHADRISQHIFWG